MEKQNKIKNSNWLSVVVTVLLIAAICLCLFVFVQVVSKGYVSIFGYSFFRVSTGSMEPELPIGTLIMTKAVDIETVSMDDIISFYSKEKYMQGSIITHRVVGINHLANGDIRLTTRGDNNPTVDIHFVDSENYIGKMVWRSNGQNVFAKIVAFISSGFGFFTCIVLPILLIAVFIFKKSIVNMMNEIRNYKAIMNGETIEDNTGVDSEETQQLLQKELDKPSPSYLGEDIGLTYEEYLEMCARIRADLIKELKKENDREENKNE